MGKLGITSKERARLGVPLRFILMVHILDALILPINSNIIKMAKRNAIKVKILLAAGCLAPFSRGNLAFSSKS